RQSNGCLIRRFRFTTGEEVKSLYFRVAVGKKISEKDGVYTIDERLNFRTKTTPGVKPQLRTVDGQEELLVPIVFGAPGAEKTRESKLELELTWGAGPSRR